LAIKSLFYGGVEMSTYDHDPIMPFTGRGCGTALVFTLGFFGLIGLAIILAIFH